MTTAVKRIFNFAAGPAVLAAARPRGGAARPPRAAGRGHVGPRDQPPLEDVREDHRRGRGKPPRARRHPRELPRPVPAGWREHAVLDGPDEPAGAGRHGRLHHHRRVGPEGHQGSQAGGRDQRGVHQRGRELRSRTEDRRGDADAGRGLRPHDLERDDSRRRVQGRARLRRRAARLRHLVEHAEQADRRRPLRLDLRRRAEEPRPGRRHAGHRARRHGAARPGRACRRC